jgi:hypothetical protein
MKMFHSKEIDMQKRRGRPPKSVQEKAQADARKGSSEARSVERQKLMRCGTT